MSKRLRPGDFCRTINIAYSSLPSRFENELCKIVEFDKKTLSWVVEFLEIVNKGVKFHQENADYDGVAAAREIEDIDIRSGKKRKHEGVANPRARIPAHRLVYDL